MFALSILVAFLAPFISRVFWKSFDEVSAAEIWLQDQLPAMYGTIMSGLIWVGALAFILYKFAEFPIELASGTAIALITLGLRLSMRTFDARILARIVFWLYRNAVSLKTRYVR